MIDLNQLLSDLQGFEVAWDYCLEYGICFTDSNEFLNSDLSGISASGRSRKIGSESGAMGEYTSETDRESLSGLYGIARITNLARSGEAGSSWSYSAMF